MSSPPVLLDRSSPVARLILNRPHRLNALDMAMWGAIPELLEEAAQDRDIKILVVSGADSRAFAAGADISEFERIAAEGLGEYCAELIVRATRTLAEFPKPTIAVIQGACIGGGCSLATCCDFRIGDDSIRIGVTAAKLGMAYPFEDTKRLMDVVGLSRAREMLLTGRIYRATEALDCGLVDRIVPADLLWSEAMSFAEGLAQESQFSLRASKAMIRAILEGAATETAEARHRFANAFSNPDLAEGRKAFLEKRRARFTYS